MLANFKIDCTIYDIVGMGTKEVHISACAPILSGYCIECNNGFNHDASAINIIKDNARAVPYLSLEILRHTYWTLDINREVST